MAMIKHVWHIQAPVFQVFEAISTQKGIRSWWTQDVTGGENIGDVLFFSFGMNGGIKVRIEEKEPSNYLLWECLDGHPEWHGTILTFSLRETSKGTKVVFTHHGWKEETEFFGQCNFSWGRYFVSLRQYCETGQGMPYLLVDAGQTDLEK